MIRFLFLFIFAGRRRRHSSKERLFFPPLPLPAQSAKLLLMVCKQHDPTSTVVMVARGALGCQSVLRAQAERKQVISLSFLLFLLPPDVFIASPFLWRGSRLFLARPLPLISFPLRSSATGKEVLRQRRRGHKRVFAVWRGAVQKVLLCHILIFLCSPDVVLNVLKKPPDSCYVLVPIL